MDLTNHQSSLISPRLHLYFPPRFLNIASSKPEWFNEFSTPTSNKLFDGFFDPSRLSKNLRSAVSEKYYSKNLNLKRKLLQCLFSFVESLGSLGNLIFRIKWQCCEKKSRRKFWNRGWSLDAVPLIYINRMIEKTFQFLSFPKLLSKLLLYKINHIYLIYSSRIRYELRIFSFDSGTNCFKCWCLSWNTLNCSSVIVNAFAWRNAPSPAFSPSIRRHWKTWKI